MYELAKAGEHIVKFSDKALFSQLSWAIAHEVASEHDPKFYRVAEDAEALTYPSRFASCLDENDGVLDDLQAEATQLFLLDGTIYARITIEDLPFWVAYAEGNLHRGRIVVSSLI